MLRYLRRALIALGMIMATALGSTTAASAVSINVYSSSETDVHNLDVSQILSSAVGFASSLQAIGAGEVIPQVKTQNGTVNIILDPRSLPGVGSIIGSAPAPWNTVKVGKTADGRKVVFPTTGGFTSPYGPRWGRMHQGIDIANNVGTPIYAVMDGTVTDAGQAQGFGQWVRLRHANGEYSVYGHVESFNVSVGQTVTAGQQIATMGNRGHSTGPHLHFEIRSNESTPVDPVTWFGNQGISVAH